MVAVVVDDKNAVLLALVLETPPHPAEAGQPLNAEARLDARIQRYADGGQRVQDVVASRLAKRHFPLMKTLKRLTTPQSSTSARIWLPSPKP